MLNPPEKKSQVGKSVWFTWYSKGMAILVVEFQVGGLHHYVNFCLKVNRFKGNFNIFVNESMPNRNLGYFQKILSPRKPLLILSLKHYQICQNFLIHLCNLSNYIYKFAFFGKKPNHFRYEHATTHYSLNFFLAAKIFSWGKSVWFTWYLKGKANTRSIWASNTSYASVNPKWHEGGHFPRLAFFGSDFVSWFFFIKNFQLFGGENWHQSG